MSKQPRISFTALTLSIPLALTLACGDSGPGDSTTGDDSGAAQTEPSSTSGASATDGTAGPGTSPGTDTTAGTGGMTSSTGSTSTDATSAGTDESDTETTNETTGGPIEPDPRQDLLELYAPRVWFTANEEYWPSTVDWAFPNETRFVGPDNNYWLRSTDSLDAPSDTLPWFSGDLASAKVYGFYAEKADGVLDLVYYVYSSAGRNQLKLLRFRSARRGVPR